MYMYNLFRPNWLYSTSREISAVQVYLGHYKRRWRPYPDIYLFFAIEYWLYGMDNATPPYT